MKSVRWKCKYCGAEALVACVMTGRRVRCPACAEFSIAGPGFPKVTETRNLPTGTALAARPPADDLQDADPDNTGRDQAD